MPNVKSVDTIVEERQLGYLGNLHRTEKARITKNVDEATTECKNKMVQESFVNKCAVWWKRV